MLCVFDAKSQCPRCGYVAKKLPCYRECVLPSRTRTDKSVPYIAIPQHLNETGFENRIVGNTTAPRGPGTELKKLLATVGINATPNCSCNARAAEMDRQGADWCEANIDTIVGWLREEAEKRGLPFLDIAGRLLVKRAIRNARKAAAT